MSYRYAVSNKPTEREPGGTCRLLEIDPSNQSEGGFAFDPNLKSDLLETSPELILVRNSEATASVPSLQQPNLRAEFHIAIKPLSRILIHLPFTSHPHLN
jgi:hypothetical protein